MYLVPVSDTLVLRPAHLVPGTASDTMVLMPAQLVHCTMSDTLVLMPAHLVPGTMSNTLVLMPAQLVNGTVSDTLALMPAHLVPGTVSDTLVLMPGAHLVPPEVLDLTAQDCIPANGDRGVGDAAYERRPRQAGTYGNWNRECTDTSGHGRDA